MSNSFLPGSTIGILGGGQLGRMLALAARRMGFRVHCLDPQPDCPAAPVCDFHLQVEYSDLDAVKEFAQHVDVVTLEFENVSAAAARAAAEVRPVYPSPTALEICQHRGREKSFLSSHGFPCAAHRVVDSAEALRSACEALGCPGILKTAGFGYDGKGQRPVARPEEAEAAWQSLGAPQAVLEEKIAFAAELSVIVARSTRGALKTFPAFENHHRHHILDTSLAPARFPQSVLREADEIARNLAECLELRGLLAVEMFLGEDGRLLVNELAPRPHNSGHLSFDACLTSQFEQTLRAVCGLPLGATQLLSPALMWNLLGHLWARGEPDWAAVFAHPPAKLHLYGKAEARPGRKMGHLTLLQPIPEALSSLADLRQVLRDEELLRLPVQS